MMDNISIKATAYVTVYRDPVALDLDVSCREHRLPGHQRPYGGRVEGLRWRGQAWGLEVRIAAQLAWVRARGSRGRICAAGSLVPAPSACAGQRRARVHRGWL